MTQTLEHQLDALIAEHGLTAISLTRIRMSDGSHIWGITAQHDGYCGSNRGACDGTAEVELTAAISDLNAKRTRPVVVPELATLEVG